MLPCSAVGLLAPITVQKALNQGYVDKITNKFNSVYAGLLVCAVLTAGFLIGQVFDEKSILRLSYDSAVAQTYLNRNTEAK